MQQKSSEELQQILQKMDSIGLDTSHINGLNTEMQALKEPWLVRIKSGFLKQLGHIRGEYRETGDLAALLNKGIKEKLSKEERSIVHTQLLDFMKVLPAGLFAAANAALPIPGTSLLTPLILQKSGLLPSRWKESHILYLLQTEEQKLRKQGLTELAEEIEDLRHSIELESDERDENLSLLLHWDANQNGKWDAEERQAYQNEIKKVCTLAKKHAHKQRWYVLEEGMVFGPTTFSKLPVDDNSMLVRFDSKCKWVALSDLTDVAHLRGQIE
jgi:hypothetical protein